MAKQIDLTVTTRKGVGRTAAKQARRNGIVPAILYGKHIQPLSLSVNARELKNLLLQSRGSHAMINLTVDDNGKKDTHLALIQDMQIDPLKDHVVHVDFHQLSATEKFHVRVPVRAVGEPIGVKEGGILEYLVRELEVECLPKDLPEVIEIDVTNLKMGQSIHIGEIKVPEGVTLRGDKLLSVITVAQPTTEEQIVAEAEAATGEVEVITAKKEEGEAAEGEAKPEGKEAAAKGAPAPAAGAKGAEAKPAAAAAPAKGAPAAPAAPAKPAAKGKK